MDKSVKPYKKKQKNQYPVIALIAVIVVAAVVFSAYILTQPKPGANTNTNATNATATISNTSSQSNNNTAGNLNTTNATNQTIGISNASVNTTNASSNVNATVNSTQLCLNNSAYVGNYNINSNNLNYSWAPYYGIYYIRIYVAFSSNLNKPLVDVSDVFSFNGAHCGQTPIFQGQTVVLPDCAFIMKVNSISLVGGAWVANVDISHC